MSTATLLDRIFDPFSETLTPESARRVADWRADDETQRLLDELGEKSNEGVLSATERKEYETYVHVIDFIGILQAKARAVLRRDGGA
jgi:hypothetical protein